MGAILAQVDDDNNEYVCEYASRQFQGPEKHYSITEKECLSVVWATKLFRHYIYGTAYTIYTDYKAILWLMNLKDPHERVARWSYALQGNNATIKHRPGKHHQNVDALSRLLQPINSPEIPNDLKFKDNNPPDNLTCNSINISNEHHISTKTLDIYDYPHLLHFLKYGT